MASTCCVFCGLNQPRQHKLLSRGYVIEVLEQQQGAEVCEPVLQLMQEELAKRNLVTDESEEPLDLSCMCCYYWIERRRALLITPLPMQKLLWFVRTLCWCEKVCDSRVLQRLVETIVEPGNVFARLFDQAELEALQSIARECHTFRADSNPVRMQGVTRFCVKRSIAQLWCAQNANCLVLPHAAAADWLRT